LTLLSPLAYFNARLRNTFYRRRTGFMLFGLSLGIAAGILLWPAGQSGQAAGSLHAVPAGRLMIPKEPQPLVEISDSVPSPTPTFPPLLTPTLLPIPNTGLVWGRNASGAYLWKSPDGKILARLSNGTKVRFLDERSSYGNLPWTKVHSPSGEGWILLTQIFRENRNPAAYITIKGGTYLRDQPRGGVQQALSLGTPIMNILNAQETEGRTWVQVEVLDGAVGWVAEEWLSDDLPTDQNDE
jgi:hypothetical protein